MASRDTIKKAYRDLAKQYHPDLNPENPHLAQGRMKDLTEAYDVVNDPDQRREYDGQPQFQLRVPSEFQRTPPGGSGSRNRRSSLWDKLRLLFARPSDRKRGAADRSDFHMHFSAGVTCAQFPGGKLLGQAEVDFSRAVELKPDSHDAAYDLGLVYYWQGKYREALTRFKSLADDANARRMCELLQAYE